MFTFLKYLFKPLIVFPDLIETTTGNTGGRTFRLNKEGSARLDYFRFSDHGGRSAIYARDMSRKHVLYEFVRDFAGLTPIWKVRCMRDDHTLISERQAYSDEHSVLLSMWTSMSPQSRYTT